MNPNLTLQFASKIDAEKMIVEEDDYIKGLGKFDLECRLGSKGAKKADVLNLMKESCRNFENYEISNIKKHMEKVLCIISDQGWKIPFPEEIVFVKTTMKEVGCVGEDGGGIGGYTRSNRIYLGDDIKDDSDSFHLITHELFHVLSRNNPDFRKKMYKIIGFEIKDKEFEFAQDILDKRISNPDVNKFDSYVRVYLESEQCYRNYVMIYYAVRNNVKKYSFLTGLVPLDDNLCPIVNNGVTTIIPLEGELADEFCYRIGRRSYQANYTDPEEIMAEFFANLIDDIIHMSKIQ